MNKGSSHFNDMFPCNLQVTLTARTVLDLGYLPGGMEG